MPWSRFTQTIRAFIKQEVFLLIFLDQIQTTVTYEFPWKNYLNQITKSCKNFSNVDIVPCQKPDINMCYSWNHTLKKIGSARSSKIRWWRNIQATRCCWARLPPILLENLEFCIWSEKIFYTCTIFNKYNFGYFRHYNIFFY